MAKGRHFKLLTSEEFAKLSRREKIANLKTAIETLTRDVPIIAVLTPPTETKH